MAVDTWPAGRDLRRSIFHGAVAGTSRPDVDGPVIWIGSVQPTNWISGDLWFKDDNVPAIDYATQAELDALSGTYATKAELAAAGNQQALLANDARLALRMWQLEADVIGATEGMVGWQGEAFLTGQDEVASTSGDITLSRGALLGDGSVKLANMPAIGEAYMGGYFAGIIDTTQAGSIIAGDDYQSGQRYALIVAPFSLENGSGLAGNLRWHSSGSQSPAGTKTRWDGLSATDAMRALSSAYEAATYAWNLSFPADGGSRWYLPALDELEVVYRNLKPSTTANQTGTRDAGTFPGGGASAFTYGVNPSSDPQGAAYTSGAPARTAVAAFQEGGGQALSTSRYYWTSTWYSSSAAWLQGGSNGYQDTSNQFNTSYRVRPCRRVAL